MKVVIMLIKRVTVILLVLVPCLQACVSNHKVSTNPDMNIERNNYSFLGEPVGPYTHAVRHDDTLYLSGMTAFGSDAQSASIELQAREVFRQIQQIAKAEGSSLKNIIKVTVFVTDLSRMSELRQVLFEIYGDNIPASALINVKGLFHRDLKIEVEAIIALPK